MKDNKKKTIIIISLITTILVLIIGVTYALFSYQETSGNSELVMGDIYMHYKENNQLILENAMPTSFNLQTLTLPRVVMGYTVNPVMETQNLNTLSRCIGLFAFMGIPLDGVSEIESFCQGEGNIEGMTFEGMLNDGFD